MPIFFIFINLSTCWGNTSTIKQQQLIEHTLTALYSRSYYQLNRDLINLRFNLLPNMSLSFEITVLRILLYKNAGCDQFFLLLYECSSLLYSPHLALVELSGWGVSIWACATLICVIMSVCSNQCVNPTYAWSRGSSSHLVFQEFTFTKIFLAMILIWTY